MHYLPADNKKKTPIDEVCYYIKNHYMEEISLNDLANVAHLNKNYLVRQFKNRFGISPISYLIKIRMEYAKKLLAESNLTVKAIATECGYNNPSFFNYYFKKTLISRLRHIGAHSRQICDEHIAFYQSAGASPKSGTSMGAPSCFKDS